MFGVMIVSLALIYRTVFPIDVVIATLCYQSVFLVAEIVSSTTS